MSEPSDALIEAVAEAVVQHDAEVCIGLDDLIPEDRERACRLARAAYAATVEHLGLRVGTSGRLISTKGTEVEP